MVMLAKSLALHPAIVNPKIILVTDRIDRITNKGIRLASDVLDAIHALSRDSRIRIGIGMYSRAATRPRLFRLLARAAGVFYS